MYGRNSLLSIFIVIFSALKFDFLLVNFLFTLCMLGICFNSISLYLITQNLEVSLTGLSRHLVYALPSYSDQLLLFKPSSILFGEWPVQLLDFLPKFPSLCYRELKCFWVQVLRRYHFKRTCWHLSTWFYELSNNNWNLFIWLFIVFVVFVPLNSSVARRGQICSASNRHEDW